MNYDALTIDMTELSQDLSKSMTMASGGLCTCQHIEQHQIRYNSDYSPAEDYDLCRQILSAGLKLANIPQLLVKYRWFGSNVSITRRPAMKIADRKVKADVRNILQTTRPPYPYYKVILRKLRLKILLRKY